MSTIHVILASPTRVIETDIEARDAPAAVELVAGRLHVEDPDAVITTVFAKLIDF